MTDKQVPEEILIADGDGRKGYTVCVDDFYIDCLGVGPQIQEAFGHKPEEKASRQEYHNCPEDPEM